MTRSQLITLWRNTELRAFIQFQARRHFSCFEDQEDAVDEAWERIVEIRGRPQLHVIKQAAYNAIIAMYRREHRRNVHIGDRKLNLDVHG